MATDLTKTTANSYYKYDSTECKEYIEMEGFMTGDAVDCAIEAGLSPVDIEEMKDMIGMLRPDLQFIVCDSLLDYFAYGHRTRFNIHYLDAMMYDFYERTDLKFEPYAKDRKEEPQNNNN